MTEYFYRKIGSPDFEFSAQQKVILPVWLPNKFYPQALYYNNAIGKVEAIMHLLQQIKTFFQWKLFELLFFPNYR